MKFLVFFNNIYFLIFFILDLECVILYVIGKFFFVGIVSFKLLFLGFIIIGELVLGLNL